MSNSIVVTGNLTGDPELRFTPSGAAVANFTVADTPRKFNQQTNAWEDAGETLFLRCSVWRDLAEHVAEAFTRGQRVTVTGRIKQRSFEKDGEKRTVVECDAESVASHGARKTAQRSSAPAGSEPWAAPSQPLTDEPPF